jgi:hypothetical protein
VPAPRDEPEVPIALRNPYKSTFLERVLVKYQEPPTGHPYNPCEHGFTPDTLSALEQMRLMTDCEKKANIKKRDYRWFDGTRAAPKQVEAAGDIRSLPYLTNIAPEKKLDRAVEVYFKKTGKDEKGVEKLIREYNKKDPEYFKAIMKEHGFTSIKQLVQYILR